jgi:hypothetical protein
VDCESRRGADQAAEEIANGEHNRAYFSELTNFSYGDCHVLGILP